MTVSNPTNIPDTTDGQQVKSWTRRSIYPSGPYQTTLRHHCISAAVACGKGQRRKTMDRGPIRISLAITGSCAGVAGTDARAGWPCWTRLCLVVVRENQTVRHVCKTKIRQAGKNMDNSHRRPSSLRLRGRSGRSQITEGVKKTKNRVLGSTLAAHPHFVCLGQDTSIWVPCWDRDPWMLRRGIFKLFLTWSLEEKHLDSPSSVGPSPWICLSDEHRLPCQSDEHNTRISFLCE